MKITCAELRWAFGVLDRDVKGKISRRELIEALLRPGDEHAFAPGEAERTADKIIADFGDNNNRVLQYDKLVSRWSDLFGESVAPHSLRQPSDSRAQVSATVPFPFACPRDATFPLLVPCAGICDHCSSASGQEHGASHGSSTGGRAAQWPTLRCASGRNWPYCAHQGILAPYSGPDLDQRDIGRTSVPA